MEQEEIKALLNRFFNGETSEDEETRLREYLSDPACSGLFAVEKEYLSLLTQTAPEPSDEFIRSLEAVTETEIKTFRRSLIFRYVLSAAATVALLIGTYLVFDYLRYAEPVDTYSDPELAMAEVRSILTLVSGNMRAATEPLQPIRRLNIAPAALKEFGLINDAVGNKLDGLRYLNNIDNNPKSAVNDKK